jgi:hypothetical protein
MALQQRSKQMAGMFTGTIEDELVTAVERMGYGIDINGIRNTVTVNTGSGLRKDAHLFKNATAALMWVEARERLQKEFRR